MPHRIVIAAALCLCLPGLLLAEPRKLLLVDFENEADAKAHTQAPIKTISAEHATSGTHSLKILLPAGWVNIELTDPEMMKKLADYRTLAIDVFNPSSEQLHFYVQIQDALSAAGKESRYDHGYYFLPPGKSTLRFSLAASPRLWQHAGAIYLDRKNLKSIRFFNGLDTGSFNPPLEFYIDNIRAEDSGVVLPAVEGLKAFQFGAARDTGDVEGFTAVTEKTPATSGTSGYCWQKPPGRFFSSSGNPDGLGNSVVSGAFVVDVKPGEYVVQTCIDPINQWGWSAQFSSRTLKLNGKEVLSEKMDGPTFVKERYCRFEDDEDTPTTDLWNDRVKKISPIRSFDATVGEDGKLTVEYNGDNIAGGMCFVVVYPKDKAKEGAAWMAALDSIRKEDFDARINQNAFPADGTAPDATADEKARGFIAFARSADKTLHCNSVPAQDERGAALGLLACPGERTAAQLGLYPLAAAKGVTITAGDLKGPGDAKIPAAAIDLKKVRHYYKRWGNGPCMLLLPLVLEKFQTLDLTPGFTRPVWVTVKIPDKLPAGEYKGSINVQAGDKSLEVPLSVTVHPFALDAADDVSISGMGTGAGFWREPYPDASDLWWEMGRQALAMQGEHGFTAATGGPGMKLKAVKDGKAEIDFTDSDRWMEMAQKYGLTKLGDSYQGFDANLGFGKDGSLGGEKNNDANAKQLYGVTFGELLKIVYAAVEQHAKEKNWPPRAFHLLDEPSGPAVDAGKVFVEAHVKNAAGSKFSGYYAPADAASKRDCFYPLLQLSVLSTVTEPVLADIHKAGNQAWIYMNPGYPNYMNLRYLYGRWLYRAKLAGLDGATGGFYYPSTVPYYDMSDVEGSWGVLYPSKTGMNSTTWFEQIGQGINDYRYLKTLKARAEAAKKAGGKDAAVQAAEQFLADTGKTVGLSSDPVASKSLSTPKDVVALRQQAAKLIQDLSK